MQTCLCGEPLIELPRRPGQPADETIYRCMNGHEILLRDLSRLDDLAAKLAQSHQGDERLAQLLDGDGPLPDLDDLEALLEHEERRE